MYQAQAEELAMTITTFNTDPTCSDDCCCDEGCCGSGGGTTCC